MFGLAVFTLLALQGGEAQEAHLRCFGCTSEPGLSADPSCIGTETGLDPENIPQVVDCDPEEFPDPNNVFCYSMATADCTDCNLAMEDMRWNRGCCKRDKGSPTCPSDRPQHDSAPGYWEVWRSLCSNTTSPCNMGNPISGTGGGGGGGDCANCGQGIIVVPGSSSFANAINASVLLLLIAASLQVNV